MSKFDNKEIERQNTTEEVRREGQRAEDSVGRKKELPTELEERLMALMFEITKLKSKNEILQKKYEEAVKTIKELVDKNTKLESENEGFANIMAAQGKIINKLIKSKTLTPQEIETYKEIKELLEKMRENNKKTEESLKINKKTQGYIATDEEGKQGLGHMEKESSGGKIPIEAFERIEQSLDNLKLEELQNEIDKKNKTDNNKGTQGYIETEGGEYKKTFTKEDGNNIPTTN